MKVSYSGGMDSTALALYLKSQGEEVELVFADTGAELPETYWFVPRVAKQIGCKLTVCPSPGIFARLVQRGFLLPSFRVRWCTRELKLDVLPKDLAVGVCADEDHRMPNAYRPLIDAGITKRDARKLCEDAGLINPVYTTGRSSCSCFCCPFQRVSDWRWLLREHPDMFALAEEWERLSCESSNGFTWNSSWSLEKLRVADESQLSMFRECTDSACAICVA
jgi:3'-phosphoadenosine 5'-phosphosulfate sulfotransferase (PAPS reductase)/FAD synthetase